MHAAKRPKHVWVVEMFDLIHGWFPCADCGLDRKQGRKRRKEWETHCPNDKFRTKKYIREQ